VTDVACLCGFTDSQYFIRCFRERFGFTPGQYRKRREGLRPPPTPLHLGPGPCRCRLSTGRRPGRRMPAPLRILILLRIPAGRMQRGPS
jgi:hypothetical protein